MGIYIQGMKMPADEARAFTIVFSNGKAATSVEPFEWHEVIPVPDHGELVDRQKLLKEQLPLMDGSHRISAVRAIDICSAKVFIPADRGEQT